LGWRFSPISNFFSFVSSRAFRNTLHSRFRCRGSNQCLPNFNFKDASFSPPNLRTCISLVEVCRFDQYLSKRFSPILTFFSLVSSRVFRDAPLLRFWCRDLKKCSLDFLKILDLALFQIYTRVFRDSRPFIHVLDWCKLP